MATQTLGTDATNSLTALVFNQAKTTADFGTMIKGIKNDKNADLSIFPGAFSRQGLLYIPNRGVLQCLPGDVVAFDSTTGWPILVSALAISAGSSLWNLV